MTVIASGAKQSQGYTPTTHFDTIALAVTPAEAGVQFLIQRLDPGSEDLPG
ncbi:MAG: hypothetical protein U0411_14585 [Thermodesulfovibrionales bacterium]